MIKKSKTGIDGFDELIDGGFPLGSNILLSGNPGAGKTIFSLQYIYNGARMFNEKGIYFTFEEKRESLIEQAKQFNWDVEKLESKNNLKIISLGLDEIDKNTSQDMIDIIESFGAKRVVVDSITTLSYLSPQSNSDMIITKSVIKNFLHNFLTKFSQNKEITTLFISQKDEKISDLISRYICDGVISFSQESMGGSYSRNIIITKMRRTNNDEDIHPLEISNEGIKIHNL